MVGLNYTGHIIWPIFISHNNANHFSANNVRLGHIPVQMFV